MNRRQQDREFRKQLLLVKGDALRMQAGVQLARWRRPAHWLKEGTALAGEARSLKMASAVLAAALPDKGARHWSRWLKVGLVSFVLARWWSRGRD